MKAHYSQSQSQSSHFTIISLRKMKVGQESLTYWVVGHLSSQELTMEVTHMVFQYRVSKVSKVRIARESSGRNHPH